MRKPLASSGGMGLLLLISACGSDEGGEEDNADPDFGTRASWELSDPDSVDADDQTVEIEVTRLDCASGETGEVADIEIDDDGDQVVIQALTDPLSGDAYTCPSNEPVPATVELDEPLGERELVDGVCRDDHASNNVACESDIRWPLEDPQP